MTLKQQIQKDYLNAFKTKNVIVKNLLSVIKGEIQTIEKNTGITDLSDEDITKILNKTAKSLKEMVNNGSEISTLELMIIESYLPKQMTREEIEIKISELLSNGMNNLGEIMKVFSTLPADKRVVSEIFKATQSTKPTE